MKTKSKKALPKVASPAAWRKAHEKLRVKEKAATHARDALAALRRKLPMVRVDKAYAFQGPAGKASLQDLFDGRPQLLLYHFMFAPGVNGWPKAGCPGCSLYLDQIGNLAHLRARDANFAVVSLAPLANIQAYKKRMGWTMPWFSSHGTDFNADFGLTTPEGEMHGLSVFFRDGKNVYRSYFTSARGLETVASIWSLLDLTPYGRQENWEKSPKGWPQSEPYRWWRRHDEY
jgi:predicted dithiol-disulfide oxidoreductase (DUF899 family)